MLPAPNPGARRRLTDMPCCMTIAEAIDGCCCMCDGIARVIATILALPGVALLVAFSPLYGFYVGLASGMIPLCGLHWIPGGVEVSAHPSAPLYSPLPRCVPVH